MFGLKSPASAGSWARLWRRLAQLRARAITLVCTVELSKKNSTFTTSSIPTTPSPNNTTRYPHLDTWRVIPASSSEFNRFEIRKAPAPFLSTRSFQYPHSIRQPYFTFHLPTINATLHTSWLLCDQGVLKKLRLRAGNYRPSLNWLTVPARLPNNSSEATWLPLHQRHHTLHQSWSCPSADTPSPIWQAVDS